MSKTESDFGLADCPLRAEPKSAHSLTFQFVANILIADIEVY
jgi:hypothetical protein